MTLPRTRSDVRRPPDVARALDALRAGFAAVEALRTPASLPWAGASLNDGIPAYAAKSPNLAVGVGASLAVVDSAEVTACRTELAAALATDRLAPRAADALGARAPARMVMNGLVRRDRPSWCPTPPWNGPAHSRRRPRHARAHPYRSSRCPVRWWRPRHS